MSIRVNVQDARSWHVPWWSQPCLLHLWSDRADRAMPEPLPEACLIDGMEASRTPPGNRKVVVGWRPFEAATDLQIPWDRLPQIQWFCRFPHSRCFRVLPMFCPFLLHRRNLKGSTVAELLNPRNILSILTIRGTPCTVRRRVRSALSVYLPN